ncbi:helix-turn-helix domain containing protein [Tsukamurella sp. 8F]|uniref:TetR/AcrR family transcriptional regulator n=1 Tax=unclassified Tsukamurella TaxID=2633480 RepID=UPI0023B8D41C|nr:MULTISPECIES: helix-turn-helix domain-containing protein [unclassified Tsukamurella]MDF0532489.1 helix-turn-helix domain containing protein [Tsukamurella sp. 8J]MDF0589160.1 helix-turn-helix domain containing protein [Tsukamurella sp. 8F]
MNTARRAYRQGARAEASERTRLAILDAGRELAGEKFLAAITLADVADRAGVTVQTVLRKFGGRDRLIAEAVEHFQPMVAAERRVPAGDVDAAVRAVVAHYEIYGDVMMLVLGQESVDSQARHIAAVGRDLHYRWVAESFGVEPREPRHRLLTVATDLYTWKLLRRDRGLSEVETAWHMRLLCRAANRIDTERR